MAFGSDGTCKDPVYYSQASNDLTSLPYSSMSTTPGATGFNLSGGSTYTVEESSYNLYYNYCYESFFIYANVPARTRYNLTVTFTLTLTKQTEKDNGGAIAFAELFTFDTRNSLTPSDHFSPSLNDGAFYTNPNLSNTGNGISINGARTNSSAGAACAVSNRNTPISVTVQRSFILDNASTTVQNGVRYQLGLFVGCNYASSKAHKARAVVSYNIDSFSQTGLVASYGSTCYTTFDAAVSAAASGGAVNVMNNTYCSLSANQNYALKKNLTFNLNGYTLTISSSDQGIYIWQGYSLTINGGGGSIVKNTNSGVSDDSGVILCGGTVTASNVTITKLRGGNAAVRVFSGGSFTASNDVTISSSSTYVNGYAISVIGGTATLNGSNVSSSAGHAIYLDNGSTLYANGATISSSSGYAVSTSDNLGSAITMYFYGAVSLSSAMTYKVYLKANTGSCIYAKRNTTSLTNPITVTVNGNFSLNTTIVYNDQSSKVSVYGTPASGCGFNRSGNNIVYSYNTYSVNFLSNGGSGSMSPINVQLQSSFVVPECTFTAPAYKHFEKWNTNQSGTGTTYLVGESYTMNSVGGITLYAIWGQTNLEKVREFIGNYMHMNSNTTGQCVSLFGDAKDAFNSLDSAVRSLFFSSGENDVVAAKNRLNAWAGYHHYILNASNQYVLQNAGANRNLGVDTNDSITSIIVVAASIVSISLLGFFLIKKKYSK